MSSSQSDYAGHVNKEERRSMSRRPTYTKFSQQELSTCAPLMTPACVVAIYVLVGLITISIGIASLLASNSVIEHTLPYETSCIMNYATPLMPLATNQEKSLFMQDINKQKNCTMNLVVDKLMKQPIYVYYQLGNYFQNHRRYVKSRSNLQLRGLQPSTTDLSDCAPQDTVNGLVIVPCGLIAWTLFNDTFSFFNSNGTVFVNKTAISWTSDREVLFNDTAFPANFANNNLNNTPQIGGAALNVSLPLSANEDLIVWMRTAALPTFRKLYGRIETDLQPGTVLTININNFYNTYGFGGTKRLVLSTTSWLGGKNNFLGIAYLAVACFCICIGLVFLFVHWKYPRALGDTSYLSWVKRSAATSTVTT